MPQMQMFWQVDLSYPQLPPCRHSKDHCRHSIPPPQGVRLLFSFHFPCLSLRFFFF